MWRVGVASIIQETNTFAPRPCALDDFEAHGLYRGADAFDALVGTNTEFAGAAARVTQRGALCLPLLRAWAMPTGPLTTSTLAALCEILTSELERVGELDALVLSLHGAMATEDCDDADAALLSQARRVLGDQTPIGVCLDLHANVTRDLISRCDVLTGYHTYPHVDMAATGGRVADLLLDRLEGRRRPVTRFAKRPMLLPAETTATTEGPIARLRQGADQATAGDVLDVSLFIVQPWLDVPELGFAAVVTTDDQPTTAQQLAERLADQAWAARAGLTVALIAPQRALELVRASDKRPVLLSESADSPTAGAAGDSPAMIERLLASGPELTAYATVVDAAAVARCHHAGRGATVTTPLGASVDRRFHQPVVVTGEVTRIGDEAVVLRGPVFTGMRVSMGRHAVMRAGRLHVLVTERPAHTYDPATFSTVGLDPRRADVIVVRSANLFRAGFAAVTDRYHYLDLPGAATPRFDLLAYEKAPRPLYPLEAI